MGFCNSSIPANRQDIILLEEIQLLEIALLAELELMRLMIQINLNN